ncbi:MAG: squalene/phytoene synthase family protein, partial [Erythrobacter sp.]
MASPAANRVALVEHAHAAIKHGSQSFSAASRLFDRETRERAWLLYAWCRRCDDIADNQVMGGELGDQSDLDTRLALIRKLTDRAFAGKPTGDPAFDALGVVARECGLTPAMAEDVIAGFALDAEDWRPRTEADMLRYCYHVAGAVGVMMAVVMGVDPRDSDTLDRACDLGLAFQLSNIARDIVEDDA